MRPRLLLLGSWLGSWLAAAPLQAAPTATLRGRVFEKGSTSTVAGALLLTDAGPQATTDAEGRFELHLPAGATRLVVRGPLYEVLRTTEQLAAGQVRSVEYLLTPLPSGRRPFEATVRADRHDKGQHVTLSGDELRTLPGGLGDPFRMIGLLPGVATPVPVLPYYVVRGASPGMNGFFLDGMRVPQLFHLLVGGGVVHARLVERLDFYPSAYGAPLGRYAGGVIDAETRPAQKDGLHGEAELRVYDLSAVAELKLHDDLRLTLSGHYGYPGPIVHAIDDRIDVQYWDYQLRLDFRGLTIEALGSYDAVSIALAELQRGTANQLHITFHRLQVRERVQRGKLFAEAALVGGIDDMAAFGGTGVRKLSLGLRASLGVTWRRLRLLAGADGELSRFEGQNFGAGQDAAAAPDELGDLGGSRDGVVAGAFVQGIAELIPGALSLTLGGRFDSYHAGNQTLYGLDPRAQLRLQATRWLTVTAAGGQYQQPPSFPVPLPGIDTFALKLGLQRAIHGSVAVETQLPWSFTFSATGYYQRYNNANDVVLDFQPLICTSPPPESLRGLPALITRQVDGQAYGMELFLRRQAAGTGRITGWLAYTLSRSERSFTCGLRPADFDQSHVVNLVLQVRLPSRMVAGARLYLASGRPFTRINTLDTSAILRNGDRLPTYVQLDLRVDREWLFRRFSVAAFLEVVNLTYSNVIYGFDYPKVDGITRYDQPQELGFRWILPSVGVRGRM